MKRFDTRRSAAVLAVGLLLAGLAGCGGRAAVQGTVTYDGTAIDNGSITFVPEGGGEKAAAQIKDGKYALEADRGPPAGKYKVEVTWNKAAPTKQAADPDVQRGDSKQMLPDKFNKATTLTAELKSGSNTVNFDLKSN